MLLTDETIKIIEEYEKKHGMEVYVRETSSGFYEILVSGKLHTRRSCIKSKDFQSFEIMLDRLLQRMKQLERVLKEGNKKCTICEYRNKSTNKEFRYSSNCTGCGYKGKNYKPDKEPPIKIIKSLEIKEVSILDDGKLGIGANVKYEAARNIIKIKYSEDDMKLIPEVGVKYHCSECDETSFKRVEIEKDPEYPNLWNILVSCSKCNSENCFLTNAVE